MEHIEIDGWRWQVGDPIGDGGFGQVRQGISPDGESVALKFVPKDPGADREWLLGGDLREVPNIVPIIARGEHDNTWVLAMPLASVSLRAHLEAKDGRLEPDVAVPILTDIATALAALAQRQPAVVHRDLKPENVLLLNDAWRLADFGIAKYAEATTAPDTRKLAKSAYYAAPEQWREERATPAIDVYAFGVMAHEMLSGALPFPGPDFREQHLTHTPPQLVGVPDHLASVVMDCLIKVPQARPPAVAVLNRVRRPIEASNDTSTRLQAINRKATEERTRQSAAEQEKRNDEERRRGLLQAATETLHNMQENMRKTLERELDAAQWTSGSRWWRCELKGAKLEWREFSYVNPAVWGQYKPAFDVIAQSQIGVTIPPREQPPRCAACDRGSCPLHIRIQQPRNHYAGRSHALWYCDPLGTGVFRWHELAFSPGDRAGEGPFGLNCGMEAGQALDSRGMGAWNIARAIEAIDGSPNEFIERWTNWFADAIERKLRRPADIPEHSWQHIEESYLQK